MNTYISSLQQTLKTSVLSPCNEKKIVHKASPIPTTVAPSVTKMETKGYLKVQETQTLGAHNIAHSVSKKRKKNSHQGNIRKESLVKKRHEDPNAS